MNLKLLCWLLLATLLMVDLCIAGKKDKKKAKKDKAKKSKDKGKSEEAPGALHDKNVGGLEPVPPHLSTPGDGPMQPLVAGGGECDPPMPGCGWSNFHPLPRPEIALPFKNGTHVNGKPNPGSGMAPKPPSSPIDRFNAVLQVMKDTEELLGESLARSMYCEDKAPGLALIDDFLNSFKLKQPGNNKKPALPDYEGLGDDMVLGDDQKEELLREAEEDNVGGWWPEAGGLVPEGMALQNRKKREVLNRARRIPNPLIGGKQRSAGPPADDGKQRSAEPAAPAADDDSWLDMQAPMNSDMGGMDDDWLDAEPMEPHFGQMSKPDKPQPAPGPPPEAQAMMEAIKVYVKQLLVLYCTPPAPIHN